MKLLQVELTLKANKLKKIYMRTYKKSHIEKQKAYTERYW